MTLIIKKGRACLGQSYFPYWVNNGPGSKSNLMVIVSPFPFSSAFTAGNCDFKFAITVNT